MIVWFDLGEERSDALFGYVFPRPVRLKPKSETMVRIRMTYLSPRVYLELTAVRRPEWGQVYGLEIRVPINIYIVYLISTFYVYIKFPNVCVYKKI